MKTSFILLCFTIALQGVVLSQQQTQLNIEALASGLDELLANHSRQDKWLGQIVVNQGGNIVYSKGNGFANFSTERPYTDSTRFAVASVTKAFTASAILLLEQEEKLNMLDKVKDYLPAYGKHPDVTIEHLVRHCSGLAYGSWQLRKKLKLSDEDTLTYDLVNDWVAQNYKEPYFAAGSKHNYSNIAYRALASIIEKVSGQSYPDFLQERFFHPLKMYSAEFRPSILLEDQPGYAIPSICLSSSGKTKPFTYGKSSSTYLNPGTDYGSYGLYISLADLTRLRTLWGKKGIFSPQTIDKLAAYDTFPSGEKNYFRFGYVATKTPLIESWNLRASGNILGFISFLIYYPEYDLCIAMSTNRYPMINRTYVDGELIDFYGELKPILYAALGVDALPKK
ncbi:hypothetical protein CEQ90_12070 [Lewinellaceae bacterium SD302]|nr:hypothetical protein CEQ90_12070 [Lewinellaceae bacterium SD302]